MGALRKVMPPGWALLGLGLVLLAGAPGLLERLRPAKEAPLLTPGVLLVAREGRVGPPFEEKVVLLIEHGPERVWGLVLNDAQSRPGGGLRLVGGPVEPQARFTLVRAPSSPRDAVFIKGDLFLLPGPASWPEGALVAREVWGYAGWAPGQLEAELGAGAWDVVDAEPEALFRIPVEVLWSRIRAGSR